MPGSSESTSERPRLSRTVSLGAGGAQSYAASPRGDAADANVESRTVAPTVVVRIEQDDHAPLVSDVFLPLHFHRAFHEPGRRERHGKPQHVEPDPAERPDAPDDAPTPSRRGSGAWRTAPAWRMLGR